MRPIHPGPRPPDLGWSCRLYRGGLSRKLCRARFRRRLTSALASVRLQLESGPTDTQHSRPLMCGIAGVVDLRGTGPVSRHVVRAMAQAILHRGPDEDGFFERPGLALA